MNDTISRQAVLSKFEPWLKVDGYNEGERNILKAILYELRFGKFATDINVGGKDAISRQAVKDMIKNHKSDFSTEKDYRTARACVNAVPPAQPKRIKGRWISADTIFGGVPFYCSECGENTRDTVMGKPRWNFCPNCGADMREVTE